MSKKVIKKTSTKRKVAAKAFSPEEMTALSNISSIVTELMQMGGGEDVEAAPVIEEEEVVTPPSRPKPVPPKPKLNAMGEEDQPTSDEDDTEEYEEREVKMIVKNLDKNFKKILKSLENTPSESATASDDAEERMEEPMTELSEENLQEVAKALALLLSGKAPVRKAKSTPSNLELILDKMVKVQKANNEQMQDLSEAFGHIVKGLGVAEQFEVTKSEEQERDEQINKAANEQLVNFLKTITKSTEKANPVSQDTQPFNNTGTTVSKSSQSSNVKKSLANFDVLRGMVGR